jgi:hypothetical protein
MDLTQSELLAALCEDPANVLEVLRATGEDLGHDEIFGADERDCRTRDVDKDRPLEEGVLQARSGQHEIERESRPGVLHRKHARLADERGGASIRRAKPFAPSA